MPTGSIAILYGTQTGTAKDVAERIAREALRTNVTRVVVEELNEWQLSDLLAWNHPGCLLIFVVATTGQGDIPKTMEFFWRELCKKSLPKIFLKEMPFAVVGLGDSSYEKFNFVAKKLFRRLEGLGATPKLEICLGDDQHDLGINGALDPWLHKLWEIVYPQGLNPKIAMEKFILTDTLPEEVSMNFKEPDFIRSKIVSNERVSGPGHFQELRLLRISFPEDRNVYFECGDVVNIMPKNSKENIDLFFNIFPQLKRDEAFYLKKNPAMSFAQSPTNLLPLRRSKPWSWQKLAYHLLDLTWIPNRYFFEVLSYFAANELEKEKFIEFSSPEGDEERFNYCNRPRRNALEVLNDFKNTAKNVDKNFIFELFPWIKPRAFSIACSNKLTPNMCEIYIAVVKYSTKLKTPRKGLCTTYLAGLEPGDEVHAFVEVGTLRFPPIGDNCNVIMVGPGTGVAPLRSYVTEQVFFNNIKFPIVLFCGVRHSKNDNPFKAEFSEYERIGKLKVFYAYSRDPEEPRMYVQDQIKKNYELISKMVSDDKVKTYIYVCGNAKQMPQDVEEAFIEAFKMGDVKEPNTLIKTMKQKRLYQTECW